MLSWAVYPPTSMPINLHHQGAYLEKAGPLPKLNKQRPTQSPDIITNSHKQLKPDL